jgi:hypothetical protein
MGDDEEESINLFLGSSDTGMFSLLFNGSIRINRFPGATAKGLGKGNANSKFIERTLLQRYAHKPIRAVFWMFGSVDVKFSYFFKLCTAPDDEPPDPDAMMMGCAVKYMEFVRSMHARTNVKTIVIGCEPNGAPPNRVYEQLLRYEIISDTPHNKTKVDEAVSSRHPDHLRRTFNDTLKHLCRVSNFVYMDIDGAILKPGALSLPSCQSIVQDGFVDILDTCVHLNWEANVLKYIPQLHAVGIDVSETLDLESTRREYLIEKQQRPVKKKPKFARGIQDV